MQRLNTAINKPAFILGAPTIIEANLINADFTSLIKKKHIIIALKLHFVIFGPRDNNIEVGVLNTKAKYYIALISIARDYDYTITNVKDFQLSTAIKENFRFTSVVFIKIKIEYNINYNILFFLINNAKKILFK